MAKKKEKDKSTSMLDAVIKSAAAKYNVDVVETLGQMIDRPGKSCRTRALE